MGLDLRLPIGLLFTLLGLILTGYGWWTSGDAALYHSSLDININFWWGLVLTAFGVVMLAFSLPQALKK